ncbi:hypothetical protein BANRA_03384 [Acinetobacter baumannii]|nr:hypothetical protein BANRA_03384 [Acinetobacter baumannii]
MAADVYLGNFDGSKYLYNYDYAYLEQNASTPAGQNTNQNNQTIAQGGNQKPPRTQDQLYQDALKAIKDAPDTNILNAAIKKFKGTTYEAGINRACQARADQMGWAPKTILSKFSNNSRYITKRRAIYV